MEAIAESLNYLKRSSEVIFHHEDTSIIHRNITFLIAYVINLSFEANTGAIFVCVSVLGNPGTELC